MKKRFKITIEINTESQCAEEWHKIDDYISNEIDESLDYIRSNFKNRNYSIMQQGTSIKVSMRTIKRKQNEVKKSMGISESNGKRL